MKILLKYICRKKGATLLKNKAHLSILSNSSNIGLSRIAVATFASELDFTLSELEEIKVAISEAVTNSIIHGYPDKFGDIDIDMKINENVLEVSVADYGVGIKDVDEVLKPSYSTLDGHMGLGLAFIDSFMDDFELDSELEKGTVIIMRKSPEQLKNAVE